MLLTALLLLLSHHHRHMPTDPLECKWLLATKPPDCIMIPTCDENGMCMVLVLCHPPFSCPE
jgi:hypothetical protein